MNGKITPSAGPRSAGTDEHWVRLVVQGNPSCFEAIVSRYTGPLMHFIYSRVRSQQDAEDLCQETFLRAFRALHTFDDRSSFKTWLYSIAFHETVSFLRKKKLPTCSFFPEMTAQIETDFDSEYKDQIWRAARQLTEDQYTVLWLKYKENLSILQIAQVTQKSRINIRVLLHRAHRKLARLLDFDALENSRRAFGGRSAPILSMQGDSNVL